MARSRLTPPKPRCRSEHARPKKKGPRQETNARKQKPAKTTEGSESGQRSPSTTGLPVIAEHGRPRKLSQQEDRHWCLLTPQTSTTQKASQPVKEIGETNKIIESFQILRIRLTDVKRKFRFDSRHGQRVEVKPDPPGQRPGWRGSPPRSG